MMRGKKKKKKKILYLWTNKEVLGSFSYNIPILYYVKHDIMKMQMFTVHLLRVLQILMYL